MGNKNSQSKRCLIESEKGSGRRQRGAKGTARNEFDQYIEEEKKKQEHALRTLQRKQEELQKALQIEHAVQVKVTELQQIKENQRKAEETQQQKRISDAEKLKEIVKLRKKIPNLKPGAFIRHPDGNIAFPPFFNIGLFGTTGIGKSSLLNSLKYALQGKLDELDREQTSTSNFHGGNTVRRLAVKVTQYLRFIDNRGVGAEELEFIEAGQEIINQLEGRSTFAENIDWKNRPSTERNSIKEDQRIYCTVLVFGESCVTKPKTQFHGGELPATDDLPITSENDAVDSKPGIKNERHNIDNCSSILTAIHRAILALAISFACTPALVAGNVRWVEPVTLDVGTRGVVTFHLQRPSNTLQFSLYYNIQFGSKGRPFCIDGQYDPDGFKDPAQVSRFTTTVIDRDTYLCVNTTIDNVNTLDEDRYIFIGVYWQSPENVLYDTQKKEVVVHRPPGPADCFITLSDSEYPYEVHCWAKTGSMPTTLTCYQTDRDLVKVQNITDNGQTTRGIFFLPDTTHFSCCSHSITSTVGSATCNDFEWPPGYSAIPSTVKTTSRSKSANRPTYPTIAKIESNVGSGACSASMIPSHWHFMYLFLYRFAFFIMC